MAISIIQQPLGYTPSNAQHAYTFSSTLTGNTDFRYVVDVWMSPRETNANRVARLRLAPNTFGVGIIDVGDIVKNYIKPNPRSEYKQIYERSPLIGAMNGTANGILTNTASDSSSVISVASIPSNSFNTNSGFEYLLHIGEYRCLIGEQWTDASGNTVVSICDEPETPISTMGVEFTDGLASYPGSPNTITWNNAASNPSWATGGEGWYYEHRSFGNTLVASGTSTSASGSYIAADAPTCDDLFYLYELATGKIFYIQWSCEGETPGWFYLSVNNPPCVSGAGGFITIWPGVQDNKINYNYNNSYWNPGLLGQENFLYFEQFKYKFQPYTAITESNPAQFLTTFGDDLYSATIRFNAPPTTENVSRVRRRWHHFQCPVVLSYFFQDFNASSFSNQPLLFPFNWAQNQQDDYTYLNLRYQPNTWNYDTSPKNRIVYTIPQVRTYPGGKMALWAANSISTAGHGPSSRVSEVVEYYFWEEDCMSDPIHFLFLNQRGVWDTYTFDRKNIKTYNKEQNVYAQGTIRNSPVYNPFFYTARDIIYDQTVVEEVEAQSNFMEENDRRIVEELFLSTSVYLIKDNYTFPDTIPAYSLTPYYIPIVITNTSLQEYKQRYNKLFQYTLTFRYNPNQLFRSNL